MRFTKVFGLLAVMWALSGNVEARKYLEFLPDARVRNSQQDSYFQPLVVPLGGGRLVWFDDSRQIAMLQSGGVDHFLAGRSGIWSAHAGVGSQVTFGRVDAAVVVPGTDDVLVLGIDTNGDATIFRMSLEGRVVVERRILRGSAGVDASRLSIRCFQCDADGTVYYTKSPSVLYRFRLGEAGEDTCVLEPSSRDDSMVMEGGYIHDLVVTAPSKAFSNSAQDLSSREMQTVLEYELDWQTHRLTPIASHVTTKPVSPDGTQSFCVKFLRDSVNGRSLFIAQCFEPGIQNLRYEVFSVTEAGYLVLERKIEALSACGFSVGGEGDLFVAEAGAPAALSRCTSEALIPEADFGFTAANSQVFRSTLRKVVASGSTLLYSFQAGDGLARLTSAGTPEFISMGDRPAYDGTMSLFFTSLPAVFDLAADGQGGAYVTYFGINALYHVLPDGTQKRVAGLGVVDFGGSKGITGDGPVEIAGIKAPSIVATLSDGSVVFVDDGLLRRIYSGFVTTLGSVNQGISVDGPISSASWTSLRALKGGPNGCLYAIDGNCIRKMDASLTVTTVAGVADDARFVDGARETARFEFPNQLAVDKFGRAYVLDGGSVRLIDLDGSVTSLTVGTRFSGQYLEAQRFYEVNSLDVEDDGTLCIGKGDLYSAVLRDTAAEPLQLQNFSARGSRGEGESSLTLGFSTKGTEVSLLVRGVGPTLSDFGIAGAASHAGVRLLEADGALVLESGDWSMNPFLEETGYGIDNDYLELQRRRFRQLGAFSLRESSHEGALTETVAEGAGFVTLQPRENEANGVALLEVYNEIPTADRRLTNCSIRGLAGGSAGALVGGFVLEGQGTKKVLARVSGPALKGFGLSGVLAHPKLRFYNHGRFVAEKSGWENDAAVAEAISQTGAFAYRPGSEDCALVLDLSAGNYTVEAESTDGGTGVALVEIYLVP